LQNDFDREIQAPAGTLCRTSFILIAQTATLP